MSEAPNHFKHYHSRCSDQVPAISDQQCLSCMHDLDLGPMTLKLKCEPDILQMYLQTKNEFARSTIQKV